MLNQILGGYSGVNILDKEPLAIITDNKGKPAHFITTADVRKVLLRK